MLQFHHGNSNNYDEQKNVDSAILIGYTRHNMGDIVIIRKGEREMRITHADFARANRIGGWLQTGRPAEHFILLDESDDYLPSHYGVFHDTAGEIIKKEQSRGGHGAFVQGEVSFTLLFCDTRTNTPASIKDVIFPHLDGPAIVVHEPGRYGTIDSTATVVPLRLLLPSGR